MQIKTQEQKRNERAEIVCREIRYQLAHQGCIYDPKHLNVLLQPWMRVAKKNKYIRPGDFPS